MATKAESTPSNTSGNFVPLNKEARVPAYPQGQAETANNGAPQAATTNNGAPAHGATAPAQTPPTASASVEVESDPIPQMPTALSLPDADPTETREWLESFIELVEDGGRERARYILRQLLNKGEELAVRLPFSANTPYINTIHHSVEPTYPGDREIERRIKSIVRWNAMAMVVRANRKFDGLGGHISTFQSLATVYQVGFHHFFKGKDHPLGGDHIYFQGHASPGVYAQAFMEGRITIEQMENFRRELAEGGGLSSYPHPWLMPDFWEHPTVSMGIGPLHAIYQARFNRYLENRGLISKTGGRVWAFLGDGETDEPESLGSISLAARERLDNLTFVINCNLQRLDGPVRGNGKIIQELERNFRGAGWNVIKVIWGSDWDPLLDNDNSGLLVRRMGEALDGHYQKYSVDNGAHIREHFFGKYPELLELVSSYDDRRIQRLKRGGHDPIKVHAAFKSAVEHEGAPTVILVKTVKGYGLGEAGEGRNVTHQQKKLNDDELRTFRDRFSIPVSDKDIAEAPFYRPSENSQEIKYVRDRRNSLGGFVPSRKVTVEGLELPKEDTYAEFHKGSDREVSTTMAFVRILTKLIKDKEIGKRIVPIVPDEARTFGMDSLFRQIGIYSSIGQLYEPVDKDLFLYYKEAKDGQILEEGITEAGSMSSFTAAGTTHATHGIDTIPFFIFYSMFGFQRVGDFIWAHGDLRGRGFLCGATSGRTTLNGEGLQHQDGHSHLLASTIPNIMAYDPAFAYEIAVIIEDGMRRMYQDREDIFYYITLGNENYPMPDMPEGCREGILKGIYKYLKSEKAGKKGFTRAQLIGSASIMNSALEAKKILEEKYNVAADIWSATNYKELRREALEVERWNLLHPEEEQRIPYVTQLFQNEEGPVIAASDYMRSVADQIYQWMPNGMYTLGTDGFGRSDTREALRRFFEVDAEFIVIATLTQLVEQGKIEKSVVSKAIKDLGVNPEKLNPLIS